MWARESVTFSPIQQSTKRCNTWQLRAFWLNSKICKPSHKFAVPQSTVQFICQITIVHHYTEFKYLWYSFSGLTWCSPWNLQRVWWHNKHQFLSWWLRTTDIWMKSWVEEIADIVSLKFASDEATGWKVDILEPLLYSHAQWLTKHDLFVETSLPEVN